MALTSQVNILIGKHPWDQYFDWYPMAEERKVRLAKMRLTKLAKTYWLNVESLRGVRRQEPIYT